MSFKFNPLSGNLDYYTETDISGKADFLVDTRTNIFAESPDAGTIAFATDNSRFYMYDGSGWHGARLNFGTPETRHTIGPMEYEDDSGYGETNLANKLLHNVVVTSFDEDAFVVKNGAIRYSDGFLQIYVEGSWLNVYPLTSFEFEDRMLWSDEWQVFDYFNKNILHGGKKDIGPFASDHLIDGGLISEQVVT